MKNKSLSYYIGTFFILLSLSGFFLIFYPVIIARYFPPPQEVFAKEEFVLTIPSIQASGRVIKNVDPFVQKEYETALKKGIAHAKNTSLPGEKGMTFLFAHSAAAPWELTRYNTVFLRLGEVEKDEKIYISFNGMRYTYSVTGKKEVEPTEVNYLLNRKYATNTLILQTCTPIGTDWKRLLIFAQLVESTKL